MPLLEGSLIIQYSSGRKRRSDVELRVDQRPREGASAKVERFRCLPPVPTQDPAERRCAWDIRSGGSQSSWGGPLFYEGKDRLRFDLSDTGGIVEYRAPGVRLLLGDGKFSLSPLTEWQAKAQGIGAEIGRGGSGLVLYTHDGAGSPRLGLRAYTASSSGSSLSFQLLTQVEPAMNILTVKGGHKTPGVEIDLEYGMLANGSGSGAQALRASGRAKLGPVEAILAVQNTDRSYTIIDNPGLDISLKLKSVQLGPYQPAFYCKNMTAADMPNFATVTAGRLFDEMIQRRKKPFVMLVPIVITPCGCIINSTNGCQKPPITEKSWSASNRRLQFTVGL